MNNEIVKITLDSCWFDQDELRKEIRSLKNKYNISATFYDGSDYYSTMTYSGTKENIKKFLDAEYIPYFEEDDYCDDVVEFLKCFS